MIENNRIRNIRKSLADKCSENYRDWGPIEQIEPGLKILVSPVRSRLCPLTYGESAVPWYSSSIGMARQPQPRRRVDRGYWYAEIGGSRVKLAESTASKDEAWKVLHALLADQGRGPRAGSIRVIRLASRFLDWVEREREPSTLEWYGRHLRSFCAMHGEVEAASIRPLDVTRWLAAHEWAEGTRAGAVTAVKRLYRWAKREGYLTDNPIADMEKPTPGRREIILTDAQYREIMAAIPDQPFRDVLTALWSSGARPGEIYGLTAACVVLEPPGQEHWVVVNKTRRKTRRPTRIIELTEGLVAMTRRLVAANPTGPLFRNTRGTAWTRHTVAHRFGRLRAKLSMGPEATAYSLRHLYVTDALECGVPIATVAELVGHADTTMVSRVYSKLSQRRQYLRDAARQIRPGHSTAITDEPKPIPDSEIDPPG